MIEFNKYLKEARQEFCKEVNKYTVSDNLQLRTACDSFLIAFDQATEQAINYTHSCTELNNCFKVGENVKYLGVKMKITFVDNCQKTVNMYCLCDETNWEAVSLSKLTKII